MVMSSDASDRGSPRRPARSEGLRSRAIRIWPETRRQLAAWLVLLPDQASHIVSGMQSNSPGAREAIKHRCFPYVPRRDAGARPLGAPLTMTFQTAQAHPRRRRGRGKTVACSGLARLAPPESHRRSHRLSPSRSPPQLEGPDSPISKETAFTKSNEEQSWQSVANNFFPSLYGGF